MLLSFFSPFISNGCLSFYSSPNAATRSLESLPFFSCCLNIYCAELALQENSSESEKSMNGRVEILRKAREWAC